MKKKIVLLLVLAAIGGMIVVGCGSKKAAVTVSDEEKELFNQTGQDTVSIASDETEYEIIIIEPGFNFWLQSIARPEGYYSQSYLENRNQLYVINWNIRATQPSRYDPDLYLLQIDYDPGIDYGYEVNYKLYNYFIFFQRKYNQRLGPFLPRI